MLVIRGYKTELDPNNEQKTLLVKNCGAARYAYNWALDIKKQALDKKEKIPNAIELHRKLNELKQTELPWMYEVSKCSPQCALQNLDKAFDNFFRNCKNKKKGKKGFPKFKSKRNGLGSFKLTGSIKVFDNQIQLPRLGKIRLKEKGYIPKDKKILSATISEKADKWFISVQIQEEITIPEKKDNVKIGIDLGIKTFITCSNGEVFENIKSLNNNLELLKRRSKQLSKKIKGSKNRKKACKKLAKLHYKISCIRKDYLHKITTHLTKTKSCIVMEDLNVSGMMKNHKLARSISDLGLYEFRRQLEYKGKWNNCQIVLVDRFFPSSKLCSNCGNKKENLKLSDRIYFCDKCELIIDRDLNASINLQNYTESSSGINAFGEVSSGLSEMVSETNFDELGTKQETSMFL